MLNCLAQRGIEIRLELLVRERSLETSGLGENVQGEHREVEVICNDGLSFLLCCRMDTWKQLCGGGSEDRCCLRERIRVSHLKE